MDVQTEGKFKTAKYKGFEAEVVYSEECKHYVGKIKGAAGLIAFMTESLDNIEKEFKTAVDDYLATF